MKFKNLTRNLALILLTSNKVMELEKINAIQEQTKSNKETKKQRKFDIWLGLNKIAIINYSASFLRLHQNKSATILYVLKKKMHVFTRNDLVFNEHEELGAGVFGVVRLGFTPSIQQRVIVKSIFRKTQSN